MKRDKRRSDNRRMSFFALDFELMKKIMWEEIIEKSRLK